MPLTRDFKATVQARIRKDPAFRKALLRDGVQGLISGDLDAGKAILRDYINATIGFEKLAVLTERPSKSLHRMLSPAGNPSMDNLAAIFHAMRECLHVNFEAHSVAA